MQDQNNATLILAIAFLTPAMVLVGILIFVMLFKRLQHKKQLLRMQIQYSEELLKSQLEVQERTFATISQEIHDNIGQLLSSAQMLLGVSLRTDPTEIVVSAQNTLGKALQELRSLSKSLDSEWLDSFNLLDNLVAESERNS